MRTIILVIVIIAIIAVLVIDGLGMYAAHRVAVEVAKGAAQEAAQVYVATQGSEIVAEDMVEQIAQEAEVELISATFHQTTSRWCQVTIRAVPKSYVLAHVPYLKDYLAQESTAVVHF